jgi:predicted Rossmann fold flavoprotein
LTTKETWIRELQGVTVPDVVVRVQRIEVDESKSRSPRKTGLPAGVLIERRGAILMTHFGLSGPAVLDVSRAVTGGNPRELVLVVDFLPDTTYSDIEEKLRTLAATDGRRQIAGILARQLPRRLVDALLMRSGMPADRRAAELTKLERGRVVEQTKRCRIRITGSRGFEKAEVTAGGVALDEVDSRTMQSKLVPNLFLAGEILDLDGLIGGYNFQAAFSTGWLAGNSV